MLELKRYSIKIEADLANSYLEDNGIISYVKSDDSAGNMPYLQMGSRLGFVLFIVNPDEREKSLELLAELAANKEKVSHDAELESWKIKTKLFRSAISSLFLGLLVPPLIIFSLYSCIILFKQKETFSSSEKFKLAILIFSNFIFIVGGIIFFFYALNS